MCGIIGIASKTDAVPGLIRGLSRLEYRGYDSAGLAVIDRQAKLQRRRCIGRVQGLKQSLEAHPLSGQTGIAHTRWATHGAPSEANTHPFVSAGLILVHNGIIENFQPLKEDLLTDGYTFTSETDSEVVVHLIHRQLSLSQGCLLEAVRSATELLQGAYALAVISQDQPNTLVATRNSSPLVVGLGVDKNLVASDTQALAGQADKVIFLEEGELIELNALEVRIEDHAGQKIKPKIQPLPVQADPYSLGQYQHYMTQEIFNQPDSIRSTLSGCIKHDRVVADAFGPNSEQLLSQTQAITLVGCGSSYLAASVARYWFEDLAGLPCQVEIASEYRYRKLAVAPNTLFVSLSQSGETADTLAALKVARQQKYLTTLSICNVSMSSLNRLSDISFLLEAGAEVSVASTKAVSSALVALMLLAILLARKAGLTPAEEGKLVKALRRLPDQVTQALSLEPDLEQQAKWLTGHNSVLFIGRGALYPVALEGALKMKELSYVHAEGYPAGELKHGPLALVDDQMPVVALAANNPLLSKLKSNLQEIIARNGRLLVLADQSVFAELKATLDCQIIALPDTHPLLAPIIYLPPLQLLAYHTALIRDKPIDRPRNLAKSVTVE